VNWPLALPLDVVTVTVTVPALPGGLVTMIWVLESELIFAVTPPKVTVAPARLVPLIVTVVPPWVLPLDGEIEVIVGGGVT
jgi:hypothetical protein